MAFAGLGVYGIIIGGWASHNKYAILGSLRATAQVIGYEVAMGLSLVSMLITYGTISLNEMVTYQSQSFSVIPAWGVVIQPIATIIFIVTAFAETNRAPFDAAEGESEIVAGYHTEYGAMKFGLFFVAEYIAMAASGALIVTLFFGGYQLPYLSTADLLNHFELVLWIIIAFAVVSSLLFLKWMRKHNIFRTSGFNETKIFVSHIRSETVVKYVDGDKLYGIEMYRHSWDLERWIPHFQHYLDTGTFDTNAYWVEYDTVKGDDGERKTIHLTEPTAIPMVLEDKVWSVYSTEHDEHMRKVRAEKGDAGFEQVARPNNV